MTERLKSLWNMTWWIKCLKCKTPNKLIRSFYVCNACPYRQNKYQNPEKKSEKRLEEIIKNIVRHLLPSNTPLVLFPEVSIPLKSYQSGSTSICAGWYDPITHTINIPRKSFYLPRKEVADTTAHECSHPVSWEEDEKNYYLNYLVGWRDVKHGAKFYEVYIDFSNTINNQFASFINEPFAGARFTVGEEIPNLEYRYHRGGNEISENKLKTYWEAEYALQEEEYSLKADKDMIFDPYNDD